MWQPWQPQLGLQRDWIWRGWRVRYSHLRANSDAAVRTAPFLFLHGFGSALTQWQENLLPLSQHQTVYALDLLGFGASEKAAAPYKVSFWVDQVYEFWQTFIRRPIVLTGHSLGALVALTAAVTYPEMVDRLVLITLPAARQELLSGRLQSLIGEIEGMFTTAILIQPLFYLIRRPAIVRSILRAVYVNSERVTAELVENFARPGRDRRAAQAFYRLAKARTHNDFSLRTKDLLTKAQVPILLLWGDSDRVIPLTWGRQLLDLNPNLTFVEIPAAGHCPYDEQSERVNQEILAWVNGGAIATENATGMGEG